MGAQKRGRKGKKHGGDVRNTRTRACHRDPRLHPFCLLRIRPLRCCEAPARTSPASHYSATPRHRASGARACKQDNAYLIPPRPPPRPPRAPGPHLGLAGVFCSTRWNPSSSTCSMTNGDGSPSLPNWPRCQYCLRSRSRAMFHSQARPTRSLFEKGANGCSAAPNQPYNQEESSHEQARRKHAGRARS